MHLQEERIEPQAPQLGRDRDAVQLRRVRVLRQHCLRGTVKGYGSLWDLSLIVGLEIRVKTRAHGIGFDIMGRDMGPAP